jgi:hypothetical protein
MFEKSILTALVINSGQFDAIEDATKLFKDCIGLTSVTMNRLALETFANVTVAEKMFENAGNTYHPLTLTAATFANLTNAKGMFSGSKFTSISVPAATFSSVTNANSMFYNCANLETLTLTLAEFGSETTCDAMFLNLPKLADLALPTSSTWKLSISLSQSSLLTSNSMVAISEWVGNVVTQQTIRLHATAYIRLQHNIIAWSTVNTNLTNKNWNLTA